MFRTICLVLLFTVATFADHQNYPGTNKRPILSDSEASRYTKEAYLQGWTPEKIQHSRVDYTVGSGGYAYIQQAVNAAINDGGTTRKYIYVKPGTYAQTVLIPKTTVPITIYGTYGTPEDVVIRLTQSANTKGSDWANSVNPGGQLFKNGDPAWSMYNYCASKDTIGTFCSGVVWFENDNLELLYLTIDNPSKEAQAVAARFDGDLQNMDHIHMYGFQDTLLLSGKRIYMSKPTIKGDVDFIFGGASAVIENAQIIARGDRPRTSAVVFAPNTDNSQEYGFLVVNSKITADSNIKAKHGCSLARAWDSSSSANGQVVIRETEVVDVINVDAPYATGAGGRPYSGNTNTNRNLDDANYNRFWEYKNTGAGA